jgi:glucose-1-phosphate adenylyltransferase
VRVGAGAAVGHGDGGSPNRACPEHLSSGLTLVGKGADLPEGIRIGRNARIGAAVTPRDFTGDVEPGGVVDGPDSRH